MLVLTGSNVLLAGSAIPGPATIEVSKTTGKITAIFQEKRLKAAYPDLNAEDFIDVNDHFLLPGLVECVVKLFLALPRSHK